MTSQADAEVMVWSGMYNMWFSVEVGLGPRTTNISCPEYIYLNNRLEKCLLSLHLGHLGGSYGWASVFGSAQDSGSSPGI